jgi:hypothetical protein
MYVLLEATKRLCSLTREADSNQILIGTPPATFAVFLVAKSI